MNTKEAIITEFKRACIDPRNLAAIEHAVKQQYSSHTWDLRAVGIFPGKIRISDGTLPAITFFEGVKLNDRFDYKSPVIFGLTQSEYQELKKIYHKQAGVILA